MKKIAFLAVLVMFILSPCASLSQFSSLAYLVEGKKALKSRDYPKAKENLSKALVEFKEIGDYIFLWRAKAYKEMMKYEEALKDLDDLKENYPKSPLIKDARKEEIEILKKVEHSRVNQLYESFINDYPEEIGIKLEYAKYLKDCGEIDKAKILFKEIFITPTLFADEAEKELSQEDITPAKLIKKAKSLNNSYSFKKAEKYLKQALSKANNYQKSEVLWLLGYSFFMQKRYSEASELFKQCKDSYWRAHSLLRGKDYESFEKELSSYIKSGNQKFAKVLITYANIKRRSGSFEEAIKILKTVINRYPHAKEDGLWFLGWTYYLMQEYEKARKIFQELYSYYGKLKYLYWLEKLNEIQGVTTAKQYTVSFREGEIYSYLLFIKGKVDCIPEPLSINYQGFIPKRIDILLKADFKEEALREIKSSLKESNIENAPMFSKLLYELGDYSTSVRVISKIPDKYSYHELLYPKTYTDIVFKASKAFNIDPYLIFAIMREESRFDKEARSLAGAMGLMQLMSETAKREGKKIEISIENNNDIFEPNKNIFIGSFYLKKLIEEFGNIAIAVAAYNAGPKTVWSWIKNHSYNGIDEFFEDILFNETKGYVTRVLTSYFEYLRINKSLTKEDISKILKTKGGFHD